MISGKVLAGHEVHLIRKFKYPAHFILDIDEGGARTKAQAIKQVTTNEYPKAKDDVTSYRQSEYLL